MFTTYIVIGIIFVGAVLALCDTSDLLGSCKSSLDIFALVLILLYHVLTWPLTIYLAIKKAITND